MASAAQASMMRCSSGTVDQGGTGQGVDPADTTTDDQLHELAALAARRAGRHHSHVPFTPAHVLAVVPLRSRRAGLLLSPLAVGSMAPDFEYVLRQSQIPGIGHTLPGVALFCVPVGLAALWLWHRFLKHPLIALLPHRYHRAAAELAAPFPILPVGRLAAIGGAIALGALTHLAWDSITHASGWTVGHIGALNASVVAIGGTDVRVYKVLQHASSVVGLGLLLFWSVRWLRARADPTVPPEAATARAARVRVLALLLAAMVASGLLAGLLAAHGVRGPNAIAVFGVRGIDGAFTGGLVAVLLIGLVRRPPSRAS